MHHYSLFTGKVFNIAEGVFRTVRNFLKKRLFLNGDAHWKSELPSVIKQYENTIHNSNKITPIEASEKVNEKSFFKSSRQGKKT